jgi:hypothetical protein
LIAEECLGTQNIAKTVQRNFGSLFRSCVMLVVACGAQKQDKTADDVPNHALITTWDGRVLIDSLELIAGSGFAKGML